MELKINRRFNEKDLPDVQTIRDEAHKRASQIVIPETLFMKTNGVKSEAEYKKKMMAQHKVMTHAHIGWAEVDYTAKAFHEVYDALHAEGYELSRFGVCLDGSMGVPEKYRDRVISGSGQVYRSPDEWKILPNEVPVAVHMGDHMIGSLNSTANVCNALNAGVTTIGNISHYFSYEYAGFDMELTARENIFLNGAVMGYSKEFIESKFNEIVEFSELQDFLDVPVRNFSSGMVARLAFSVATVVEPEILIVDEILSVGDIAFQAKSETKMLSMIHGGTTVLYVSHSLESIKKLCDRVVWLEHGKVVEIGETKEICDRYAEFMKNK